MTNTNISADAQLSAYRQQIDALDDRIIALIKERTGIVKQVGALKADTAPGACPLRPGREATQLRRVFEQFKGGDFQPEAAIAIWRALINASLAVEGELRIAVYATDEYPDLYWLTREYFGSFANIRKEAGVKRVIGEIMDGKASIGVVPMLRTDEIGAWWPDLAQGGNEYPKIFAHIPFTDSNRHGRDGLQALAIGRVTPEPTGEDVSFVAIEAEDNTSMHKLQTAFAQAKIAANWVDVLTRVSGRRHHLVEMSGFVPPEHEGFQQFLHILGNTIVSYAFLGAYAVPITLHPTSKGDYSRHESPFAAA